MKLRNSFCALCFISMFIFVSCLGSDDDDYIYVSDAGIYTFKVQNDSIDAVSGSDSVIFTIDQVNGLIYNKDSLRFGTELTEKLVTIFTGPTWVLDITDLAEGDSAWISSGDSLDFSKPRILRTYGIDGYTNKTYTVSINIHQVNPDSFQYKKIASDIQPLNSNLTCTYHFDNVFYTYKQTEDEIELYTSTDAINWQKETTSGLPLNTNIKGIRQFSNGYFLYYVNTSDGRWFGSDNGKNWSEGNFDYPILAFLGVIKPGVLLDETLACIILKNEQAIFASTSNLKDWTYSNAVPADFPLDNYSVISYNNMLIERLSLVGGISADNKVLNTVWSTTNGLTWSKLSGGNTAGSLPQYEGISAFLYNDDFYLINGKDENNVYNNETYYSKDGGVTWQITPIQYFSPTLEGYIERYNSTVIVDDKNFIYIFGGKYNNEILTDVWRGRLNKLAID